MKNFFYIVLIISLVSCRHNQEMKSDNFNTESMSVLEEDFEKTTTSESFSIKKFEEFIDLMELKQAYPEFKDDIDAQLKSYTTDSLTYPLGFGISNIKQLGDPKPISDSVTHVVLGYTINVYSETYKDSILAEITRKDVNLNEETFTSKKIKFLKFK
ncbi:hypothetical protein [uncultured Psychroserpens sp.]|uniref:hypothetical protein n=1 Tax=uncultured Psychroserpens sp. TaxID=255436 RepID=UPI002622C12A|nr:hypothetical protein [uncultured Psychroserpens sp.]